MTGKFFALEGLECSGKTTLFNNLKKALKDTNVEFISETAGRFATLAPEIYKDKETMEIAYMTDNAIIMDKVSQLIKKEVNVIMDRTWICQLVYARVRKILNPNYNFDTSLIEKQDKILSQIYPEVYKNTVVVFLSTDIETLLKRGSEKPTHHRHEEFSKEWLEKARIFYKERLDGVKTSGIKLECITSIDRSQREVLKQFINIFQKYTKQKDIYAL